MLWCFLLISCSTGCTGPSFMKGHVIMLFHSSLLQQHLKQQPVITLDSFLAPCCCGLNRGNHQICPEIWQCWDRLPEAEQSGRLSCSGNLVHVDHGELRCGRGLHQWLPHNCWGLGCRPGVGAMTTRTAFSRRDSSASHIWWTMSNTVVFGTSKTWGTTV